MDEQPPQQEAPNGRARRLLKAAKDNVSLSKAQQIAGLTWAVISISGFAFSYIWATTPSSPTKGDVVAVVQEQRSDKPLPDATIEVLTMENAIVTTLTAREQGRVTQTLKEGHYRFRVMHPRFGTETRQVYVIAGQTSEVRFRLVPRPVATTTGGNSPLDSLKKIFR